MELAQLKYFQVMANIRHFTRAARMLDVTQPALSRSMAKLERDLDVPLFKRNEGEIELTTEGERLLRRVDRILREVDSPRGSEQRGRGGLAGVSTLLYPLARQLCPASYPTGFSRKLSGHPHPAQSTGLRNARTTGCRR